MAASMARTRLRMARTCAPCVVQERGLGSLRQSTMRRASSVRSTPIQWQGHMILPSASARQDIREAMEVRVDFYAALHVSILTKPFRPLPLTGPCQSCEAGTWKGSISSSACTECEVGKYSTTLAATAESTCEDCPANSNSSAKSGSKYRCYCTAGYSGPDGGDCAACPAGKYKTTQGSMACTRCPPDTYSTGEPSSNP
jgi:hypothetical protein